MALLSFGLLVTVCDTWVQLRATNLIVVAVTNQSMLGIDQDPTKSALCELRAAAEDGPRNAGAGKTIHQLLTFRASFHDLEVIRIAVWYEHPR